MKNERSWVVLENRGALGVSMIRHPYASEELAEERAYHEAISRPGTVLYTAEVKKKFEGVVVVKANDLG